MPRGVSFPDLVNDVEWVDKPSFSETAVYSARSGDIMLVVKRSRWGWFWWVKGWLGVQLLRDERMHGSRCEAKRAVLTWWGRMTVADRAALEAGVRGSDEVADRAALEAGVRGSDDGG